jgi:O-antigen ligase
MVFALQFLTQIEGLSRFVTFGGMSVFLVSVAATIPPKKISPPKELRYYLALILVSLLALPLVVDFGLFFRYWRRIAQLFVMMVLIAAVVRRTGRIDVVMKGLLGAASAAAGYGWWSGDLFEALGPDTVERATGVFSNANGFAHVCLLGLLATLHLWDRWATRVARLLLALNAALLILAIVASGSRGAFVGTILLTALWLWFCKREEMRRRPTSALGALVLTLAAFYGSNYVLHQTFLGQRLTRGQTVHEVQQKERRVQLFAEGWRVFLQSPIIGVGLNQFRAATHQKHVGHADLVELPSTTGILGTWAYYAFIAGVGGAASRALRGLQLAGLSHERLASIRVEMGLARASAWLVVFLGFITMTFWDIGPMILLAAWLGHAWWYRDTATAAALHRRLVRPQAGPRQPILPPSNVDDHPNKPRFATA